MADATKVSGINHGNIEAVSGVSIDDLEKVSGVVVGGDDEPASRWLIGGGSGRVFYIDTVENAAGPASNNWATLVELNTTPALRDIAYGEDSSGNKRWILLGNNSSHQMKIANNTTVNDLKDSSNWSTVNPSPAIRATTGGPAIAFTNTGGAGGSSKIWVAGGIQNGSTPNARSVRRSSDGGDNWTVLAASDIPQQPQPTRSICYKSGRTWYATNDSDIWASTDDGETWTEVIQDPGGNAGVYNALVYDGEGTWVTVGNSGQISYSTNDWATGTAAASSGASGPFGSSNHIYGLVYCGGSVNKWIACGQGGVIAYSGDGDTWTAATTGLASTPTIRAIATDDTTIVAVGDSGLCLTSTDGTSFTSRTGDTLFNSTYLQCIACDIIGAGMRDD